MEPRIFVHPNYVRSKSDGDSHFISYGQLCRLYMVNPNTAYHVQERSSTDMGGNYVHRIPLGMRPKETDIHLYPDYDGNYPLFDKEDKDG